MKNIKIQQVREAISLESQCLKKPDFIRNELIPYYGKDITLEDLEKNLWNQYFKFHDKVNEYLEDS